MINTYIFGGFISLVILIAGLGGCTDKEAGKQLLPDMGYTNIKYEGFGWFDCGEDDWFRSRYSAINPKGKRITLTICEGLFKGKTIRY